MRIRVLLAVAVFGFSMGSMAGIQAHMTIKGAAKQTGPQHYEADIFYQAQKFRMDSELHEGSGKMSFIQDGKTGKIYSVIHASKTVMVIGANQEKPIFMVGDVANIEAARKKGYRVNKVGTETIEGYRCDVYEIVGNATQDLSRAKAWFAPKLKGFMLKTEGTTKDGSKMSIVMTKVKQKKLAKSVFLPPKGYRTTSMPNLESFSQSNLINEMEGIQSLPESERKSALEKYKKKLMKRAQELQQ